MDRDEARRVLGVDRATSWADVRRAYRDRIRHHHPDRAGDRGVDDAVRIIQAFKVLEETRNAPEPPPPPPPRPGRTRGAFRASYRRGRPAAEAPTARSDHGYAQPGPAEAPPSPWQIPIDRASPPPFHRLTDDTLHFEAPVDETFRWLLEGAHQVGEITYLDRSGPLMEVLCRFVGEPATSLLVTFQGRAHGTDAFCSAESIEARTGPPTAMVVDVLEHALRLLSGPDQERSGS